MSRRAEDQSILSEKLRAFLADAGWVEGRPAKGLRFYLPLRTSGYRANTPLRFRMTPQDLAEVRFCTQLRIRYWICMATVVSANCLRVRLP